DFRFNTHSYFPESGSRKRFHASGMRAIDSPHEITPRNMILREKFQNFSIFASIHTSISLNQGQGSIFTLRECAQSTFRLKITIKNRFLEDKRNKQAINVTLPKKYKKPENTLFSNRRSQKQIFQRPARSVWVLWGYNHSKYHHFDMGCEEKIFFENWLQSEPPPLFKG